MIIDEFPSIIIACDVGTGKEGMNLYRKILKETGDIKEVGGYQIKSYFGLDWGLENSVRRAKEATGKKIIYEHNTLGYGDERDAKVYAEIFSNAGIDAVTLELTDRNNTSDYWIGALMEAGIGIIARGKPTFRLRFDQNLDQELVAVHDDAIKRGVRDLQIPANKPNEVREILAKANLLEIPEIKGVCDREPVKLTFYPVGFGELYQGGKIEDVGIFGERFHPIVGRLIYTAPDIKKATNEFIGKMNASSARKK